MRAREIFTGNWGVVADEPDGEKLIVSGLRSNEEAWQWIDKHSAEGRDATDRHNRIRDAFNGSL